MGWAQWIIATLMVVEVIGAFVRDGKPREPWSFTSSVLSAAVMALLLHAGGFWQ